MTHNFGGGIVRCPFCGSISKVKGDLSRLESHFKHEHEIQSNVHLLLPFCFLNEEELSHITQVTNTRMKDFLQSSKIDSHIIEGNSKFQKQKPMEEQKKSMNE